MAALGQLAEARMLLKWAMTYCAGYDIGVKINELFKAKASFTATGLEIWNRLKRKR
jgi:hypothetical protein